MRKLFKDVSAAIIILILFKNGKLHSNHHMYVVNTKEVNKLASWLMFAQLVKHCIGITAVKGSAPVQA